jgi:hypothetical protein
MYDLPVQMTRASGLQTVVEWGVAGCENNKPTRHVTSGCTSNFTQSLPIGSGYRPKYIRPFQHIIDNNMLKG